MLEVWLFWDLKSSFVWRYVHKNWSSYEWEIKDWLMHWKWKLTVYREWWYEVHEWTFREWFLEKWIKTIVDKESTEILEWNFKDKKLDWKWKQTVKYNNWDKYEFEWNFKNWALNWIWKTVCINEVMDDGEFYVKVVYTWELKDWYRSWKWKLVEIDKYWDTKSTCEWMFLNWLPNWYCIIKDDEEWFVYKWEVKDGVPHWMWVKDYWDWDVEKWYFESWKLKNNAKLF